MIKLLPLLLLFFLSCSGNLSIEENKTYTVKEIIEILKPLSLNDREDKIFDLAKSRNIPAFMNSYSEISIYKNLGGKDYKLSYYVLPDYFSLGNESDYILLPMTPGLAQRIADLYGCILPTKLMSDQIYSASKIKYYPQPIAPSAEMITVKVFADHNDSIKFQRQKYFNNCEFGLLSAGHKKDIIISNYIYSNLKKNVPNPVVIYGWHKLDGKPIQPLYNGHGDKYADYSHGVRLIKRICLINGKEADLTEILKDTLLSQLVSDEGVIMRGFYTWGN